MKIGLLQRAITTALSFTAAATLPNTVLATNNCDDNSGSASSTSVACGINNNIIGYSSLGYGINNTSYSNYVMIFGEENTSASGSAGGSLIVGRYNQDQGTQDATIVGSYNKASGGGNGTVVVGYVNEATQSTSVAVGGV